MKWFRVIGFRVSASGGGGRAKVQGFRFDTFAHTPSESRLLGHVA